MRRKVPATLFETGSKGRVLEYIVTHLNENITNDALAEVAGLSVCHFARMFK
jgi:AraC-like DNA-binding protein